MKRCMYQYMALLCTIFLVCAFLTSATLAIAVQAEDGDDGPGGNFEGDGGGDSEGTDDNDNKWSPGKDGVRISVVEKSTRQTRGTIVDWTNQELPDDIRSFVKRNKVQYREGYELSPNLNEYQSTQPYVKNLPWIVSSDGSSNIAEVKAYFQEIPILQQIAEDSEMPYETLSSGDYIILIEPVLYFRYQGLDFAMTATEVALYDRQVNGNLRSTLGFITHQNLPRSVYLEYDEPELNVYAWDYREGGVISNESIIAYLGIGTINFGERTVVPPPDEEEEEEVLSRTWGEWYSWWDKKLVKVPGRCTSSCAVGCTKSHSTWEDHGEWKFRWDKYSAQLTVDSGVSPDEAVPATSGEGYMKSGYGVNLDVDVNMTVSSGGRGHTTPVQNVVAVFPEFEYHSVNRWLEPESGVPSYYDTWQFKSNQYSQFKNPVHFTPLWYPSGTPYPVAFAVLDAWTPAGQLYCIRTATDLTIQSNVYSDWHAAPGYGSR